MFFWTRERIAVRKKIVDFHKYQYALFAGVIILCAVVFRLFLMAHNWPLTDSEEGTMGLEAMHIAFNRVHPIYFYGQNYMGVAEAYLGAIMFRLFGVSIFSLRLGMLLFFTTFLVLVYLLGSLLYGRKVACVALLLMVFGAVSVLVPEMKAVGGAVETLVFGTTVMLLASWLALNSRVESDDKRLLWARRFAYAGWGLAIGLGLWSHLLIVPFAFCSTVLLISFCWRDLFSKNIIFLLIGLLIGVVPLIRYNISALPGQNSLQVFMQLHNISYPGAPTGIILLLKQISGTFLFSLPIATGMPQIIYNTVLPLYSPLQPKFILPILLYGAWSLGYMVLLGISSWNALKSIKLLLKKKWSERTLEAQERQALILHTARLLLLACAWLTILSYVSSSTAAQRPWSYRYLVGLMVTIPAVIAPLMNNHNWLDRRKLIKSKYVNIFFLAILLVVPIIGTFQDIPQIASGDVFIQQQSTLVDDLLHMGIKTIYSGYWVCDRVIFQSREQITCASIKSADGKGTIEAGLTRYHPYEGIVEHSKRVAYVFTKDGFFNPPDLIKKFSQDKKYSQVQINDFIVFVPV
jgi:4-amino-4-deoxy-L-arabinose transferase-like glycosyltransferase